MNLALVGALFLGGFVGYLLGLVIKKIKKPSVQHAVAIVGAAVTGAPVFFLEGIGPEKWMYPVGLVAGVFWSRFADVATVVSRGPGARGRFAWYMAVAKLVGILCATVVVLLLATRGKSPTEPQTKTESSVAMSAADMPCRLAWVWLGKYSESRRGYELPPAFRYHDRDNIHFPIPRVGDKVVMTIDRNLIVSGYGVAPASQKCDKMLDVPEGYRPETAIRYQAGKISAGKIVIINQMATLPSNEADPSYIWALVGPP